MSTEPAPLLPTNNPIGKAYPTADRLREVLSYDPATGVLTWIKSPCRRLPVGTRAGSLCDQGYRTIRVDGVTHREHRIIWTMLHGEPPSRAIDHINRDRSDNRISNLRLSDLTENAANQKFGNMSSTGFRGVYRDKRWEGKFIARVCHKRVIYQCGRFDSAEAAHEAYLAKARELRGEFFHDEQEASAKFVMMDQTTHVAVQKMTEEQAREKWRNQPEGLYGDEKLNLVDMGGYLAALRDAGVIK